jgi:hypothetical protein
MLEFCNFDSWCLLPNMINFVLEGFNARKLEDIQEEMDWKTF